MTSTGRHQTKAVLVTPFTALGASAEGLNSPKADRQAVDLSVASSSTEPFVT
jgi:hypothetical protein